MRAPNTVYRLTLVRYKESSREMVCSFSNNAYARSHRFAFFPSLLTNAPSERLFTVLSKDLLKQIQLVEAASGTTKLIGASFSLLKTVQQQLQKKGFLVLLLEPERQFLLQQNSGMMTTIGCLKRLKKASPFWVCSMLIFTLYTGQCLKKE